MDEKQLNVLAEAIAVNKKVIAKMTSFDARLEDLCKQFETYRQEMEPYKETMETIKNGRNGLVWIAVTISAIGGAIFTVSQAWSSFKSHFVHF